MSREYIVINIVNCEALIKNNYEIAECAIGT